MTTDVWKTPEEAVSLLGEGWEIRADGQSIVKRNSIGTIISMRRIYTGEEHPLAQPGMVVFRSIDPLLSRIQTEVRK